jgi:hypothetical protein
LLCSISSRVSSQDITVVQANNLFARVEVSWQSDLVTNRAKHQLTSLEQPPKYQKSLQGNRVRAGPSAETAENFSQDVQKPYPSAIPRKPDVVTWSSIDAVQESYRSLIHDGRLKYNREPQLISMLDGSSKARLWDPYILTESSIPRAKLDEKKVEDITRKLELTIRIVPKAVEWEAKTQEYHLTTEEVEKNLQNAFVYHEPSLKPQPGQKNKPILGIAARTLRRAMEFKVKDKSGTFRREEAVLRMVAYAAMEVSIATEEATDKEVSTVDIVLFITLTSGGRILDEVNRCWRKRLADADSLFCPLLVLGDGKCILLEGSRFTPVIHDM